MHDMRDGDPFPPPDDAAVSLRAARSSAEIEQLADQVATHPCRTSDGDRALTVDALVGVLSSDWARRDEDVEDAVCSALVRIGLMARRGNLIFEFLPDDHLAPGDLATLNRYRAWLPVKYSTGR
jgi:hypothetical protein